MRALSLPLRYTIGDGVANTLGPFDAAPTNVPRPARCSSASTRSARVWFANSGVTSQGEDSKWCPLVGIGSAAPCVRSGEDLLPWCDYQRRRRLRHSHNRQRYYVLPEERRLNLVSKVLSLTLW